MNEHDSERLAGLMVADGLVPAEKDAIADVVIFNTCTIRENADLRLYSALGELKDYKKAHPEMQIAVGGCMAQKDRDDILNHFLHSICSKDFTHISLAPIFDGSNVDHFRYVDCSRFWRRASCL